MLVLPSRASVESRITQHCEDSLHAFIIEAWNNTDPQQFKDGKHIAVMAEYLEAFVAGEIRRLLINVPPGHMKSLASSVFLNAWTWVHWQGARFMGTSYRGDLAFRDADKTRSLIKSQWYQERWGDRVQIRRDRGGLQRFENTAGGYRFSTSTSGIMGEGGDFVILDDPHNVIQAESDNVRDETVRKIRLALPTRVRSDKGGVLVIMQRLHSRDYAGAMLADAADLVHLCLPATLEYDHPHLTRGYVLDSGRELPPDPRIDPEIDGRLEGMRIQAEADAEAGDANAMSEYKRACSEENGELLFPQLFDQKRIDELSIELTSYGIAGQLQQRPRPREGGVFKRDWFTGMYIDAKELPRDRVVVRGWDLGGSTDSDSPYTRGVRMSYSPKEQLYCVEDGAGIRAASAGVENFIRQTAEADGYEVTQDLPQDPGQAGKAQIKTYSRLLAGYRMKSSPESGSKIQRAEIFAAQCEHGNVRIVRGEWNASWLDELCDFPTGDMADWVDATSRACARLLVLGGRISSGVSSGSY